MAYNYSWNDSPAPVTPSNISSLPQSVQKNPPLPVARPTSDDDWPTTTTSGYNPMAATGPSGPVPSTPVQGNPFFNFLTALFGHSGGSPQQGMTGLLARGQGAPGTNSLGNPFNRFG